MGALCWDSQCLTMVNSVNLVLVEDSEIQQDHVVRLCDRRFEHIRKVLKVGEGDDIRVGIVDGAMGFGRVLNLNDTSVTLRLQCDGSPPHPTPIRLVLGCPRPKVARRILSAVASFGVKDVALVGGYRVEKSYWDSPLLAEHSVREAFLLGLEQGRDTLLPTLTRYQRFKPFVEDVLPDFAAGTRRLLLHPGHGDGCPAALDDLLTVAIGPDGGWTSYEVEQFQRFGFERFQLGPRILRVETAVSAILGRLLSV